METQSEILKDPRYHAVVQVVEDDTTRSQVLSFRTQSELKTGLSIVDPKTVSAIFRGKRLEGAVRHQWSLN